MTLVHNDFQDKSMNGIGTFSYVTVIVEGSDFNVEGITFENLQQNKRLHSNPKQKLQYI